MSVIELFPKSVIIRRAYFHRMLPFFLWIVVTAFNIDKAFHIDDTFHLEAATYLMENPSKPMSGIVNWGNGGKPMHVYNQPPLFFYLMASVIHFFGYSEIALHLFISIFTLLSLLFFQKTTELLFQKQTPLLLVLFALCPAFIVNQNVMIDVSILSILLAFLYYILKARGQRQLLHYSVAAVLLSIGLLMKYSLLPLIPVLFFVLLVRKHYKYLIVIAIPLVTLSLWSLWNYMEYGGIHLLERTHNPLTGKKVVISFLEFTACIGAVVPFSISLMSGAFTRKRVNGFIYFMLLMFLVALCLYPLQLLSKEAAKKMLQYFFLLNGLCLVVIIIYKTYLNLRIKQLRSFLKTDSFLVLLIAVAISSFIILFAPFMATRHVLLVIPLLLIYGYDLLRSSSKAITTVAVFLTLFLGIVLGISDWKYANYYRTMATQVNLPKRVNAWTVGHCGWQWYAKQQGMVPYDKYRSLPKTGDYMIAPVSLPQQSLNDNIHLTTLEKKWEEADLGTFFSGNDYASMYISFLINPPWSLSMSPIDTIVVSRITIRDYQAKNTDYYER